MLILLVSGRIVETGLIKRNGGCGYVWEIHHSDDCYSGGWRVVAQNGDTNRADTAKTANALIGTADRQNWIQADQI